MTDRKPTIHVVKFFLCFMFVFAADLLSAQSKVEFQEGYYLGKNGEQVNGLLAYKPNARRSALYCDGVDSVPKRIKASRLAGFVIGKDSFAVISDFTVEGVYTDLIRVKKPDIAKVLEIGPVILYQCHYIEVVKQFPGYPSSSPTGHGPIRDERQAETIIPVYILRRKDSPVLQSVPESQASFNKAMAKYFQDDPNLAEEIANGKYANGSIQKLVQRFNAQTH